MEKIIHLENQSGLFNPQEWDQFSSKVSKILADFLEWLRDDQVSERRIFGYGAAAKASTLLKKWSNNEQIETLDWSTHEWLHFIRHLPANISLEQMSNLDSKFNFTNSKNSEIILFSYL